ncbi:hypothetical protein [Amnibacterium setariae]|uniref:Uncharacterized protein n=1 Tax=Amnibacterium setariae TaxID=2306585 RepID=A0A3A1TYA5_9MICO|nr:hypothetical protein [Amnibacterium setariae]RIX28789.1 hypothetical protein D1781_15485 [Amnibacterium setariae]
MTTSTDRRQRLAAPATRTPSSAAPAVSLVPAPAPGLLSRLLGRARTVLQPRPLRYPAPEADVAVPDSLYRNDEGGSGDDGGWG